MKTLFDKIWDAHVVQKVEDGPTQLYIDRLYCHEVTTPQEVEEVVAKLNKDNADLFAAVAAMVANYQGEDKIFAADSFVVSEAYVYEIPVTAEEDETITKETAELPVYASDDNKIVYEVYENGTAFLLNFNNYTVIVDIEIDGVVKTYTLDAYGYIVLSKGN